MFAVVAPRTIQPLILLEFFNDFCSSEQDHLLDRDASEVPENYEGDKPHAFRFCSITRSRSRSPFAIFESFLRRAIIALVC